MDHSEWAERVKKAVRRSTSDPEAASQDLLTIASDVQRLLPSAIQEYHLCQALSLAATVLEGVEDGTRALEPLERQEALLKGQLVGAARALTSAAAQRALVLFSLGRFEEASDAVKESLRVAALAPGGDYHLEQALTRLREYELSRERPDV